jgi:hypothetical protein
MDAIYLEVNRESIKRRAEEILAVISHLRVTDGMKEAIHVVVERFVEEEAHPELKRVGEVLALARRQALIQQLLDLDREALHHGKLGHDELVSTGHHYEMLRHQACTYNHMLRGFIESCSQYVTRDELMDWLTRASLGREVWARGEVTGAVSEVALHAALQGLPEIRNLRYASVEEDLIGYDFVATCGGKLITIDAKTGRYLPLSETKHGHRHLEISVPREMAKDLRINHHGLAELRRSIRGILNGPLLPGAVFSQSTLAATAVV